MNETMVYADGFEKTFATAEEMLDFLSRRGKASEWIRKPIRALRLVPLEKEAGNLENGDEEMEEILKDTEKHTRLVLKRTDSIKEARSKLLRASFISSGSLFRSNKRT